MSFAARLHARIASSESARQTTMLYDASTHVLASPIATNTACSSQNGSSSYVRFLRSSGLGSTVCSLEVPQGVQAKVQPQHANTRQTADGVAFFVDPASSARQTGNRRFDSCNTPGPRHLFASPTRVPCTFEVVETTYVTSRCSLIHPMWGARLQWDHQPSP